MASKNTFPKHKGSTAQHVIHPGCFQSVNCQLLIKLPFTLCCDGTFWRMTASEIVETTNWSQTQGSNQFHKPQFTQRIPLKIGYRKKYLVFPSKVRGRLSAIWLTLTIFVTQKHVS